MGEAFGLWAQGLSQALTVTNLLFALVGCVVGTLVGVLPGFGPAAATAVALPITFTMEPIPAIIMLCAIYYGSQYGGTITSILLNVPGESATVITCIDGYPMARAGRAGAALAISAIGSVFAGIAGTFALVLVALPLARVALSFGPAEIAALLIVGLSLVLAFRGKSLLAGVTVMLVGLMVGTIGLDPVTGTPRFTFGSAQLFDGIDLIPVIMGLYGIAEVLVNLEQQAAAGRKAPLNSLLPSSGELRDSAGAIGRGTVLGFALGLVPGLAGIVPTSVAYALEKRVSRNRAQFGSGAIQGVAVAETANNAHAQGTMVPLLTLGIPGTASLAVLMGAFMVHGITPGPFMFRDHPEVVWTVIASFLIGNLILFVLNFPLVGMWAKLLKIPPALLNTGILLFCFVGAYSVRRSVVDILLMLAFGVLGYVLRKLDWPIVPLVIAVILGPMLERAVRAALELSGGSLTVFVTSPLAAALLAIAVTIIALSARGLGRGSSTVPPVESATPPTSQRR